MIRLTALIIPFLFSFSQSFAQQGNEWINYSQHYLKIPVAAEGIYRITADELQAAGFPVGTSDAKKIQLFHRGIELAILVVGESDGLLSGTDYLEFYGQKNDGTLDTELYENPSYQPHLFYNLFSDTTNYLLTVGTTNGKRAVEYQESSTGLTPETYHLNENLMLLTSDYSRGKDYGQIAKTVFDIGEGWMSPMILYNHALKTFTLEDIEHTLDVGINPSIEIMITGRGPKAHPVDIYVGSASRLLNTVTISGYETRKNIFPLEWSDIDGDGNLTVSLKVNGEGTRVSVNYIKLTYPQELNMDSNTQFAINLPSTSGGKSLIEIQNVASGTRLFDVTDPANIRVVRVESTNPFHAVVKDTDQNRNIFVTSVTLSPELRSVHFRQINPSAHNYVIITHPMLRKPAGGYSDPVEAYAAYRASATGGGYDTLVVNIDQLYDQFSYGERTPVAIFHFMKFLSDVNVPDYLFIIGKGLDVAYNYHRNTSGNLVYKDLIPPAGAPGSDIAFTAGLNGSTYEPGVATGRITAMTPDDVAAYFNKVKETETRPFDDLRRKNILHLSGGVYPGEPQEFREYLNQLAPIAENFYLGGVVDAIAKQSTDLKLINIAEEVNKGLNLVTFFGHSSTGTLDFDIGYASDPVMEYNNKGKYPVLLMNGCDAGAFFLHSKLFGEDWINTPDKGAIGFIAHSSLGFIAPLRKYSTNFYQVGYGDSVYIQKGIGDIQKETIRRYLQGTQNTAMDITHAQQMVLLGDPAVPLFGARFPDLAIHDNYVSISAIQEETVTAASDSFAINFIVRNFGQAQPDSFRIEILRTLNDRSTITYDSVFAPVLYSDTLQFIIKGPNLKGSGNNTFAVKLDTDNIIDELREDNNIAYLDYFIPLNSTQNLYPRRFSIVSDRAVNLSFQHTDIRTGERDFMLEIDTLDSFDSPYKQSYTLTATVLALKPIILLEQDTLVYYWRTRLANPLQNESKDWLTSSFTYIHGGPKGWAQVHFPQFIENTTIGLVQDPMLRRMNFQETTTSVAVTNFGSLAGKPADSVSLKIGNAEYNLYHQGFGCRDNTINLVAFDRKSTIPYMGVPFQWFNRAGRTCGREPWAINSFDHTQIVTGNNDDLLQYVENVAMGDSVVLFSIGDAGYELWPDSAKVKLGELGISQAQLDALLTGEPVVIFGRKGIQPGTAKFYRAAEGANGKLAVDGSVTGRFTNGEIRSVLIGPATQWHQLTLQTQTLEVTDVIGVDVIGINATGEEILLFKDVSLMQDLSSINAETYPSIRLVYSVSDDINLTAVQLKKWIVSYEPVSEGVIFFNGSRETQTIFEGVHWEGEFGFVNVSNTAFAETLTVTTKIFNHETLTNSYENISIEAPAPGDTTLFTVGVNTFQKVGLNDVEVFVNPKISPEQYYENNVFLLSEYLDVVSERFNPILDVSIDGRYIESGEYVSSNPIVDIKLWDENPYLRKTDTTGMSIFLAYPCDNEPCQFTRINFSASNVAWFPATDTSDFEVKFSPMNLGDGDYTLRIEARDQSGNASGIDPYEISFKVKSEVTAVISHPYPNPSSSDLNLKLLITGDNNEIDVQIEVIGLNGILVQKLDTRNFADLHVGNNILTWEAKRSSGAPLPAGIYLYRIIVRTPQQALEQRGKISLLR